MPGFAIDAKVLLLSSELAKEQLRLRALHSFPHDATILFGFSVAIKPEGMAEVSALLDELTNVTKQMWPALAMSFVFEGNNLCFGCNLTLLISQQVLAKEHQDIIQLLHSELKLDQSIEIGLRLKASPKSLLAEGAEPFILQIL